VSELQNQHVEAMNVSQSEKESLTKRSAETEETHAAKVSELQGELQRLSTELEGQEAQYAAKVDAVKAEHDVLLQQAFEKAKTEAGDIHAQELQTLRKQSHDTMEQLTAQHQAYIADLKAEHLATMEDQIRALEKAKSEQSLDLKATQDDLAKAKAALAAAAPEIEALKKQVEEAEKLVATVTESSASEHASELQRLHVALTDAQDEVTSLHSVVAAQKASIAALNDNHVREREDSARTHVEETVRLRSAYDEEKSTLAREKGELMALVSDLEGEVATLRAAASARPSPPSSPKGNGVARSGSPSVSKEDLQRLHDAHNAKMIDLEAQHEEAVRGLAEERDIASVRSSELSDAVDRKTFENELLERENTEKDDTISRLQDDLATAYERLAKFETGEIPK